MSQRRNVVQVQVCGPDHVQIYSYKGFSSAVQGLDSNGRQNPCSDGALSWGWDGEEVGCIKESAKENERWAVRFILHREEADWLEEDRQWDHWTRVMMSALSLTVWGSGIEVRSSPEGEHPGRQTAEGHQKFLIELMHVFCHDWWWQGEKCLVVYVFAAYPRWQPLRVLSSFDHHDTRDCTQKVTLNTIRIRFNHHKAVPMLMFYQAVVTHSTCRFHSRNLKFSSELHSVANFLLYNNCVFTVFYI